MSNEDATAKAWDYKPSLWLRFWRRLFPGTNPPKFDDVVPPYIEGGIFIETWIKLDWKDRLRFIVSGKLLVQTRTETDCVVRHARTCASVTVLSPIARIGRR